MTRASWAALLMSAVFVIVVAAIVVNYFMMAWYVGHVDSQWCDTLRLLTAHPVPRPVNPSANPSRVEAWQLFTDFLSLRKRLGC